MADFSTALSELLAVEGVYSSNPHDSGGETVQGISRANFPSWPMWQRIEDLKVTHPNLNDLNHAILHDADIQHAVSEFYHDKFWRFDEVAAQDVASRLLSVWVNFGNLKPAQEALIELGYHLSVDGGWGPDTQAAISHVDPAKMMHYLRAFCAMHRAERVLSNPSQITFLKGWLIRDTA